MAPSVLFLLFILFVIAITLENAEDNSLQWHYEEGLDLIGPTHWYQIEGAELCGHSQQSPIEIDPSHFRHNDTCSVPLNWTVPSTAYNFSVSHKGEDGHTIVLKHPALSQIQLHNPQHSRYKLDSLHFHWGPGHNNGSEHVFTGFVTTLEVHFVHYAQEYHSVGSAFDAWENASRSDDPNTNDMHTLAVVGFLFEETIDSQYDVHSDAILLELATNTAMHSVWSNATGEAHLTFAITDLVNTVGFMDNYYYYDGSLTTPPCKFCQIAFVSD